MTLVGNLNAPGVLPEEINKSGCRSPKAGSILVDFADETFLALQVSRVELPPSLLPDSDPVDDGEFLPVDGVWVEGPVTGHSQLLGCKLDAKCATLWIV